MGKQNNQNNKKRKTTAEETDTKPLTADHLTQSTTQSTDVTQEKEQEYQRKYKAYSEALLTSYRYCDDQQQLKQTLEEIFHEGIDSLKEIFSLERFQKNKAQQEDYEEDYELCLFKFFLEFASFQLDLKDEDCWAILNWLRESKLEDILAQQEEVSMVEILIAEGHQQGVKWAFEQYDDQELLQIFTKQWFLRNIQEIGNISSEKMSEIIKIICEKKEEIFINIQENIQKKQKHIESEKEPMCGICKEIEGERKKLAAIENLSATLGQQILLSYTGY